jgi:XTP/dITP diphosphohydrolase
MRKLVLATSNRGKLAELQPLLGDAGFALVTQGELGVEDAIEDGLTFVENALIKARHACRATGLPALGDDSGLVVDALDGAPGLYSARYAGEHGNAQANIAKLLQEMRDFSGDRRRAHFYCVLVALRHADDPQPLIVEGAWHGHVLETPRGDGGFGYDPVFLDPERGLSAAQIEPAVKNRISHRGIALAHLRRRLAEL